MRNSVFYNIFVEFVQEIYDVENQIVEAMPEMISQCTHEELKKALSQHLDETKEQVRRLENVFDLLGEVPTAKKCQGINGIINEGKEIIQRQGLTPAVKDCFIIISAQQIEHYEIASYGSVLALVKHLKAASDQTEYKEIYDILNDTLEEEWSADKKLTTVAEGKLFFTGINDEIEDEIKAKK